MPSICIPYIHVNHFILKPVWFLTAFHPFRKKIASEHNVVSDYIARKTNLG